ncbi:cytochrome c oxidase subunit II [Bacillus sp. RG28]|uniref:Cytochrome aa3 subunit 2 n=1 Tax=Gottfriedia endophytica TaxID=2820819 RepID=A0A940NKG4_9BACI|nr:cytochrome c oxidase subunit II [Gottfriedia endophytica]MBP0724161.1 cytochrome c oxidase subunit II [Gottfriedia endophytica]
MHMHKMEKIWLFIGIGTLILFLAIVGVNAFYMGNKPPSCIATINPDRVSSTPPFNHPGVKQIGKNHYQVTVVASAFSFDPGDIKIPLGAKVDFVAATKDVVHGFEIAKTDVNFMIEPGYISTYSTTFKKPGEYLLLCNEYCGTGHQLMATKLEVVGNEQ